MNEERVLTHDFEQTTEHTPMDESHFLRIKAAFERKGGVIDSSAELDRHLESLGADAATLDALTIIIRSDRIPSASAMFEELVHTAQYRTGRANGANWIQMEIEAKGKLVRCQKQNGIPDAENAQTVRCRLSRRRPLRPRVTRLPC